MSRTISDEYEDIDGTTKERASMEDAMTMQKRLLTRTLRAMGEERANELVIPSVNAYNTGHYDQAVTRFETAIKACPAVELDLACHVEICRRVLSKSLDSEDHIHLTKVGDWKAMSPIRRWLMKLIASDWEPDYRLRCKYCGHYTPYVDPYEGLAYFGTNNCRRCGRGYPMPDFVWDGVDGQAYIYYRGSVQEDAFYTEFEARFDVNPRMRVEGGKWVKKYA